jgi:hypothetical protein
MDAFLSRMNSTIIQWRTYLASLNGDTLVLSNAKVDEFVAMVEHVRKIHREGETDDTPTRKRKREEEEADSDHSPTFKREMERVDKNMRRVPPRASQRMQTRAQAAACRLEFELANLNAPVVHEIGESSSAAFMWMLPLWACCGQCEELLCTRVLRRRTKAILTIQCVKKKVDNMDACMCETK